MTSRNLQAFTLIELMIAITVIAIITSISIFGLTGASQKAADTSRLSGVRELQLALEGYKSINGKYPIAGIGAANYVDGLEPGFIAKLPQDKTQTSNSGFKYVVSSDRKTYCVAVMNTVFKPESQKDLNLTSCAKSWGTCKGADADELVGALDDFCQSSSGGSDLDNF